MQSLTAPTRVKFFSILLSKYEYKQPPTVTLFHQAEAMHSLTAPTLRSSFHLQIPKSHPLHPHFSLTGRWIGRSGRRRCVSSSTAASTPPEAAQPIASPTTGLYSAKVYELTADNVNLVLEDVRPYLIADGGNVDVVSVEDGVVSLKLQGACGNCPSSTTTMTMGIERVLKEKFGDAIKDIRQVFDDPEIETTVEAVNRHLDILRPAIKNFGGSVEVISVEGGECHVKYVGPDSIGSGIKAAIKEKFPDIINVVFSS